MLGLLLYLLRDRANEILWLLLGMAVFIPDATVKKFWIPGVEWCDREQEGYVLLLRS